MFHVGQKVVCVDASDWGRYGFRNRGETMPSQGEIYTIRGFTGCINGTNETYIWLVEIVNPPMEYRGEDKPSELRFNLRRFRPVVDISDLQSIVTEVFQTKRRKVSIPADKFDKHKVHSSAAFPPVRHDGAEAASPTADATAGGTLALHIPPVPICPERSASLCANSAAGGL